jgi:hypothetical protein
MKLIASKCKKYVLFGKKILFCHHYFSPLNTLMRKGKDPDPGGLKTYGRTRIRNTGLNMYIVGVNQGCGFTFISCGSGSNVFKTFCPDSTAYIAAFLQN